jgi:hypothetical protein
VFAAHSSVDHAAGEYVRHGFHHSNTVENYFSILKRGITGTFLHVSEAHLSRYLAEFDFRYFNRSGLGVDDTARTQEALKGIGGKRLTYRGLTKARTRKQKARKIQRLRRSELLRVTTESE